MKNSHQFMLMLLIFTTLPNEALIASSCVDSAIDWRMDEAHISGRELEAKIEKTSKWKAFWRRRKGLNKPWYKFVIDKELGIVDRLIRSGEVGDLDAIATRLAPVFRQAESANFYLRKLTSVKMRIHDALFRLRNGENNFSVQELEKEIKNFSGNSPTAKALAEMLAKFKTYKSETYKEFLESQLINVEKGIIEESKKLVEVIDLYARAREKIERMSDRSKKYSDRFYDFVDRMNARLGEPKFWETRPPQVETSREPLLESVGFEAVSLAKDLNEANTDFRNSRTEREKIKVNRPSLDEFWGSVKEIIPQGELMLERSRTMLEFKTSSVSMLLAFTRLRNVRALIFAGVKKLPFVRDSDFIRLKQMNDDLSLILFHFEKIRSATFILRKKISTSRMAKEIYLEIREKFLANRADAENIANAFLRHGDFDITMNQLVLKEASKDTGYKEFAEILFKSQEIITKNKLKKLSPDSDTNSHHFALRGIDALTPIASAAIAYFLFGPDGVYKDVIDWFENGASQLDNSFQLTASDESIDRYVPEVGRLHETLWRIIDSVSESGTEDANLKAFVTTFKEVDEALSSAIASATLTQ